MKLIRVSSIRTIRISFTSATGGSSNFGRDFGPNGELKKNAFVQSTVVTCHAQKSALHYSPLAAHLSKKVKKKKKNRCTN